MFKGTRNWLKRNRTNFAIGAGLLGAGYVAGQYVLNKFTEARQRMSDDRTARENLRRRFEQNQEDCTYTVLALLPTATENVLKAITVEKILQELQHRKTDKGARSTPSSEIAPSEAPSTVDDDGRSFASSSYIHTSQLSGGIEGESVKNIGVGNIYGKKTKLQLWNDLKLTSITRAFTLIYTLSLLTLLTRVQLNLLGRRTYLSSVVSLASPPQDDSKISLENRDYDNMEQDYGNDYETNRKYLTFSWWLLHRGWTMIMNEVELAVKDIFAPLTPRDNVTFERLSELVLAVRKRVEGSSEEDRRLHNWLAYLLPPREDEDMVLRESGMAQSSPMSTQSLEDASTMSTSLRRLLDETSDLVESPTFSHVLTLILDSSFSLLIDDKIAVQAYNISSTRRPNSISCGRDDLNGATATVSINENRIQEFTEEELFSASSSGIKQTTAKLATILAVFTRQAHVIGSGGNLSVIMGGGSQDIPGLASSAERESNEYLTAMDSIGDLEAFAAVVYSSNFESEGVEETSEAAYRNPEAEIGVQAGADRSFESVWNQVFGNAVGPKNICAKVNATVSMTNSLDLTYVLLYVGGMVVTWVTMRKSWQKSSYIDLD